MGILKAEIEQNVPFSSAQEEALLNLVRTADRLSLAMQRIIRPWGVTATQYNVLRILRGAGPDGLTCSQIGNRMLTADPDITRLLSRLKGLKLIRQNRDCGDRRVVRTVIAEGGLRLLKEMDPVVTLAPDELLGHMTADEIAELTRLLERARERCGSAHDEYAGREESSAGTAKKKVG
ncbi:MAG TPA: MarR family transcriptional regulator [Terracidiphilus sp.]|nr:MarR family transcriptional regulator [Terracidiphilus sp.]